MRDVLQVRFSEIYLKGLNRPYFLRMLVERVKDAMKAVNGHELHFPEGTGRPNR